LWREDHPSLTTALLVRAATTTKIMKSTMITETTTMMKKTGGNFFKVSSTTSSFERSHRSRRNSSSSLSMVNSLCVLWASTLLVLFVKTAPSTAIVNHKSPFSHAASFENMDVDYYDNSGAGAEDGIVDQSMGSLGLSNSAFGSSGILVDSSSDAQMFPYKEINFISPTQELAQSRWWYDAPLSFSAKGMDHLYLLNNFLMDLIQPSGLPDEIIKDQLFTDPLPLLNDNRAKVCFRKVHRTFPSNCFSFFSRSL
jgi:hypothetical protein